MEKRKSTTGHMRYADNGDVFLETPYREQFIKELKKQIPATGRSYDRDAKTWRVDAVWVCVAEVLMSVFFPHATRGRAAREEAAPTPYKEEAQPEAWIAVGRKKHERTYTSEYRERTITTDASPRASSIKPLTGWKKKLHDRHNPPPP
jgi:hypothetical protein